MTGSIALPLEEEYEMQEKWRDNHDKLTFIAVAAPTSTLPVPVTEAQKSAARSEEVERMFGDVNLFINRIGEDDGTESIVGELEIMIARKDVQGQGYGKALLKALIWYIMRHHDRIMKEYQEGQGLEYLPNFDYLHCRIGKDNFKSIWLFEGLDFRKINHVPNYFEELELRWDVTMQKRIDVVEEGEEVGLKEEDYLL